MKKISTNFIYNFAYKVLLIIAPLITTPYLSRKLGAGPIGQYSYISTLVSMLLLVGGLGTGLYAQRGIAQNRNDIKRKSTFFVEVLLIRVIGIMLCLGIFIIIALRSENKVLYLICSIEIIAYIFDISWLYQGDEDFGKILFRNIVLKLLTIIWIFILIKTPNDLWKYAFLRASSVFISNVSIWPFVGKHVSIKKVNKINLKKHMRPIIMLFIPQISIQLYSNSDKLMLKWIKNSNVENGYYDQTYKIIDLCLILVQALNATLLPRLSFLYANKEKEKYKDLLLKSIQIVLLLSIPMFLGLLLIADEFTKYFFGQGFEKVGLLLKLYSPFLLISMFSGVICQQYLVATGNEGIYMKLTAFVALFNITINTVLINKYSSIGAVISTVLSEFILFLMVLILIAKEKIINVYEITNPLKKYIGAGLVMAFSLLILYEIMPKSLMGLLCKIIIAILVYFSTLILFRDSIVNELLVKLLKKKTNI